jgi:predicted metalloendopeptidase
MRRRYLPALLPGLLIALCAAVAQQHGPDLKSILDTTCKPCDDFNRYVNQKWIDSNPIPAAYGRWGTFTKLAQDNRERMKTILDGVVADNKAGKLARNSNDEKLAVLYTSCLDTEAVEKRGLEPVQAELDRIAAIDSRPALEAEILHLDGKDLGTGAALGVTQDAKNSSEYIASLSARGSLSLPDREFYFRTDEKSQKNREEFQKYVATIFHLTGDSAERAATAGKTILEFETRLAEVQLNRVQRRDPYATYHRMDLAGVEKEAPGFNWGGLFDAMKIPRTTPVNLSEPRYFATFTKELGSAPLETWKTYLKWRLLSGKANQLPKAYEDAWFEFNQKVLSGVKEPLPRWERCTELADRTLGDALGEAFVRRYFPPVAKQRMDDLVAKMRVTLGEELARADWLSPETKKQALAKLDKIAPKIGYPSKWKNYSSIELAPGKLLENVQAANLWQMKQQIDKLGKPVDRTEWHMTPPTVNAYYSPQMNEIVFPAGILQPPFFDVSADDAVNYGAIGVVIGHEIGHGFDDQGAKYDGAGNLRNWWTDDDKREFEKRTGCVIDQFNSFDVQPGLRHTGKLIIGEAAGDLSGITLAYRAYHRSLNGKPGPVIDGLTADQRFFIAFARVWATNARPEEDRLRLQTDPHPLPKYRVIETLKNVPEFAQAFGCHEGDAMVKPADQRCKLW